MKSISPGFLSVVVGAAVLTGCASRPAVAPAREGPDFAVAVDRFIEGVEDNDADSYVLLAAARDQRERSVAADLLAAELALQAAAAGRYGEMNKQIQGIGDERVRRSIETRMREAGLPVGKRN